MQINPESTLYNLGGKGYHLSLLKDISNVPKFFVIKFDNIEDIARKENQRKILDYYQKLGFKLVSVRSSATIEDSVEASFAGMFDSILNIDEGHLIRAIKKVINSMRGNRVIEYCKQSGIDYNEISMRVVVQQMVDSEVAGVCFTRTPDSNKTIMIEACLGLGEALVSGKITPDKYVINRDRLEVHNCAIGYQNIMLKNSKYVEAPLKQKNSQKLSDSKITQLIELSLKVEQKLGLDGVDIEWAMEKDTLYLLQARAVTFESKSEVETNQLPNIKNYQLTFKVTGLDFMFADLLCRGFGYLHPLFVIMGTFFNILRTRKCSMLQLMDITG